MIIDLWIEAGCAVDKYDSPSFLIKNMFNMQDHLHLLVLYIFSTKRDDFKCCHVTVNCIPHARLQLTGNACKQVVKWVMVDVYKNNPSESTN